MSAFGFSERASQELRAPPSFREPGIRSSASGFSVTLNMRRTVANYELIIMLTYD